MAISIFLDSLKSEATRKSYRTHFDRWEKATLGKAPLEAEELENRLVEYLGQMKEEGLSYSYRNSTLAALKHFYAVSYRNLRLNWEYVYKFLGENIVKNELRGYTREEIQKMLDVSDVQQKAMIITLASTGARREAIMNIKLKDMKFIDEYQLYKIKIYPKTKFEQICFTTPEAATAIKLYLSQKKVTTSNLFDYYQVQSISVALRRVAIKAGVSSDVQHLTKDLKTGQFRDSIPATHGLRKYCISAMKKSKIDTETAKMLTGHSIGVRGKYLDGFNEDDLLEAYLKAIDNLTIKEENRLQSEVSALKAKDDEITQLKSQMSEMQQTLKEMYEQGLLRKG